MERLQGPINPLYIGEHLDVECYSLGQGFLGSQSLSLELEELGVESHLLTSSLLLEDNMPFLQMLQSVELPPFFPLKEPNFQTLLKLQHLKKPYYWDGISPSSLETQVISSPQVPHQTTLELESCVTTINTHDNMVDHFQSSQVKCENFDLQNQNPPSSSLELEGTNLTNCTQQHIKPSLVASTKERKKRKRARPSKNKEEVENQRMTHIAVERNRRRLMNEHLNSLRSLMPPSYIQRGDQASIIGGAIDFVKELEQLLQSLEVQKTMKRTGEAVASFGHISSQRLGNSQEQRAYQVRQKSEVGEIEITTIQNHVKLKVQCQKRPSQLLRAIVAFEELRLTVLHLNITSSQSSVLYTFNLKIEEECKLRSADEVAAAVHQIFTIINRSCLAHAT